MQEIPSPKMPTSVVAPSDGRDISVRVRKKGPTNLPGNMGEAIYYVHRTYCVFKSFEDNASQEWQPAPTGETAQSHNLVLSRLENLVFVDIMHELPQANKVSFPALFHCPPTLFLAQLRMSRSHRPMIRLRT